MATDIYPQSLQGKVERIDKPIHDRDTERVIGAMWSGGQRKTITIVRVGGRAKLCARGTSDDLVRWWELPDLDGYGIFAMTLDGTHAPRPGIGKVLIVTLLVQKLDAGQQEESWNIVTDLPYDDQQ